MQDDDLNIFVDPIIQFDHEEPERRLYLAIIGRALIDILKKPNEDTQTYQEDIVIRDRAHAWFFCSIGVTCDNFEFICDHAGVEPGYVRSFAYEAINSGKQGVFRYHIYRMLRTTK